MVEWNAPKRGDWNAQDPIRKPGSAVDEAEKRRDIPVEWNAPKRGDWNAQDPIRKPGSAVDGAEKRKDIAVEWNARRPIPKPDGVVGATGMSHRPRPTPGPRPKLWVMWANAALSWSLLAFLYLIYLTIRNITWATRNRLPWFRYMAPILTVFTLTAIIVILGMVLSSGN